jgi:hypothetical protein
VADERKGFLLRLPPRLLDELRGWAEQDMRSINGQIEWIVREALRKRLGHDPERGKAGDLRTKPP